MSEKSCKLIQQISQLNGYKPRRTDEGGACGWSSFKEIKKEKTSKKIIETDSPPEISKHPVKSLLSRILRFEIVYDIFENQVTKMCPNRNKKKGNHL